MSVWRWLKEGHWLKEMRQLREENQSLREMTMWLSKAQERSINADRRKADYMQTAPQAQVLLKEECFKTAYSDLIMDIQRKILNSNPEEVELRESCYRDLQSIQKMAIKLSYQLKVARGARADK